MAHRAARRLGLIIALIVMACASVAVAVRAWPESEPDRLRQQALIELQSGRFSRAAAALDRLRSLDRPMPADWMLRAQVDLALGRIPAALSDLQAVSDDDPMAARARLQEGRIELRRDRARAAEAAFLRAVARDPKLIEARRELVYIYGMQMRRRELQAQFEALSELTPLTFDQVRLWCLTRMSDWDPREVEGVLESFVAADPEDRASRLALADTYRRLGRPDEAERRLAELPSLDPDARVIRIRMAQDRGDDRTIEPLLEAGPDDHVGLARFRGRRALGRRDFAAAIRYFRIVLDAEPNDRDTLFNLATALVLTGDVAAAKALRKAADDYDNLESLIEQVSQPSRHEDLAILRALGAAYETFHRRPEARAWYRLALARDPLDPEVQKALFRLESPG
jgi:tetratricopeptide (TPR) repeat protein